MSFIFSNLFKANEQTKDYYIRKPNDEIFLFEIEHRKIVM